MKENFYVLGSVKSSLNLKSSSQTTNLELDVLRLIHYIKHLCK